MKPEFYVFRLGRNIDPNKAVIGQQPPQPRDRNARAQRAALGNFEAPPLEAADAPIGEGDFNPQVEGYGQEINRNELRDPVIRFSTKELAEAYAAHLAEKTPKTPYCVVGVISVFETLKAPVIEKKFNDRGELVVNEPEVTRVEDRI